MSDHDERYHPQNNAALAVLASRVALATAVTTATGNDEPDVAWVSSHGSDDGDGSYSRPFRTFAAAAAAVVPPPTTAAEFRRLRIVRTRGPVTDGAGQPPIVLPTARVVFELDPGSRMPQVRCNPLNSERFGATQEASYVFRGRGITTDHQPEIHGAVGEPSVTLAATAGDVIASVVLAFEGVECLGGVQKLVGSPDPTAALVAADGATFHQGCSAPWAQPYFDGRPSVLLAASRFRAPTVMRGTVFGDDVLFATGNTGSQGSQGLVSCRASASIDLAVTDGGEIWMDTDSAHRLIAAGCTVSAAGAGLGVTRVIGDERLGEGNPAAGEQRSRHAWISGRGHDNPLKSIFHGSAQFPYASLDAAVADLAPAPQDKDDFQCEVEFHLAPGVHHGPAAGAGFGPTIIPGLSCVRLVLHGAELPDGIQWVTLNSYRFGETEVPLLDIVGIGHQTRASGEVGEIGDGTKESILQVSVLGDQCTAELRLQNIRLRGGFEQDAAAGAVGTTLLLRWRNVEATATAPDSAVLAPSGVTDWERVVCYRPATLYSFAQGMRECRFLENVTADVGSGPGALIGHLRGCEFSAAAPPGSKAITLTAGSTIGMDGVTNGNLKRAGWVVTPATVLVDLLDDTVAPIVPV